MAELYKVLGQSSPASTTDTAVYTVPSATSAIISTISVCNRGATTGTVRIFIRPDNETLDNKHYIIYDSSVPANDTIFVTIGATMDAADVLYVRSSNGNFSFNVFGSEIS